MTLWLSLLPKYDTLVVMISRISLPGDQHHLAYVDAGEQDSADVLLLLHGGGLDHRMWSRQFRDFPDWRVIAPDARNHGSSSTATGPYRLVDDVAALLDALGVDRVVAVGCSMGAGTAVDLSVEHPDRVRGLVVTGTGTSAPEFEDPWVLDVFATLQRAAKERDPELWVDAFSRFLPGPHRRTDQVEPAVVALCEQMVRDTLATHVLPVVASGRTPVQPTPVADVDERRKHIRVPVLAIVGGLDADDHIRFARDLIELVGDGEEAVIPRAAHYPNLEYPDEFNRASREFLGRLGH